MDTLAISNAFFDLARISAPIYGDEHLNGWIVTGMGMFIAFSCLLIIMAVVKYLPYLLKILDFIIPEKVVVDARKVQMGNDDSANETVAAAIAVAYHNYNDSGR